MTLEYKIGDCLELMKELETDSIDMVLTDPPYGINKAEWDSAFPYEAMENIFRISKRQIIMCGNWELPHFISKYENNVKDIIILRNMNGMTRGPLGFGNYIPAVALGNWKWKARPNLIDFTVHGDMPEHPSPKPIDSMIKLIKHYSEIGETILDPFLGSGTTILACRMTDRNCIGYEIDPKYEPIIKKRIMDNIPRIDTWTEAT